MKKVLALILALAMAIGMIPTAFAALTEEADGSVYGTQERSVEDGLPALTGYEYVFNHASHHVDGEGNPVNTGTFEQIKSTVWTIDNTTTSSDKWGYVNVNGTNYTVRGEKGTSVYNDIDWKYQISDLENGPQFNPDSGGFTSLALEIVIDNPGKYIPSLTFNRHTSSPKMEIFLVKATESKEEWVKDYTENICSLDAFSRIGVVYMYGSGTDTETFLPININEAGNYYPDCRWYCFLGDWYVGWFLGSKEDR